MTIRLSAGLRNAIISSYGLGSMMYGGHIRVYTGAQPESADAPATGTLLAQVTQDGASVPGSGGLQLQLGVDAGELVNLGAWVIKGVADGTPGWWRFQRDDDSEDEYHSNVRIDGTVLESVLDMPPVITASTNSPVAGFLIAFPNN